MINLFGTGRMGEIIEATGSTCLVVENVADREALGVPAEMGDPEDREGVDPSRLAEARRLDIVRDTNFEETGLFVRYAEDLDDGEAWTCAAANARGATVASDDRKTLRLLESEGVPTLQTPELLRRWAEQSKVNDADLREALHRIEKRASFRPRSGAPEVEWWRKHATMPP